MPHSVGQFFDRLSADYTVAIERCFPRYREMLWALLDYIPSDRQFTSIVELGCGTGNLSVLLAEKFPESRISFVDLSADSLAVCRKRLGNASRFEFLAADFDQLDRPAESVDLVISSIALHHLDSAGKQRLFARSRLWLTAGGLFTFADQFRGTTQALYARHMEHWQRLTLDAGSTADDWRMWMQHQQAHDHHDTLCDQLNWLRAAGYTDTDCTWRYLLWAVVQGTR